MVVGWQDMQIQGHGVRLLGCLLYTVEEVCKTCKPLQLFNLGFCTSREFPWSSLTKNAFQWTVVLVASMTLSRFIAIYLICWRDHFIAADLTRSKLPGLWRHELTWNGYSLLIYPAAMILITKFSDCGWSVDNGHDLHHYGKTRCSVKKCKLNLRYAIWLSDLLEIINMSRRLNDLQDPRSYFYMNCEDVFLAAMKCTGASGIDWDEEGSI